MTARSSEIIGQRSYPVPERLPMDGRFVANPFSNMRDHGVRPGRGGIVYPTIEHYYVAMKIADPGMRPGLLKMTAKQAKSFGRGRERPGWTDINMAAMWTGLVQVWTHPQARGRLSGYATVPGDSCIVEWNNWGDRFWGCDIRPPKPGQGANVLGRMLRAIRDGFPAELGDPELAREENWVLLQQRLAAHLAGIDVAWIPVLEPARQPDLFAMR